MYNRNKNTWSKYTGQTFHMNWRSMYRLTEKEALFIPILPWRSVRSFDKVKQEENHGWERNFSVTGCYIEYCLYIDFCETKKGVRRRSDSCLWEEVVHDGLDYPRQFFLFPYTVQSYPYYEDPSTFTLSGVVFTLLLWLGDNLLIKRL